MINRVFIDTSGWIELILKAEVYHQPVKRYFHQELTSGSKLFTNDYVLAEAWTRLITNQSFNSASRLRQKTAEAQKQKQLLILHTDEVLFQRAWQYFCQFREHRLSFTDALIYTVVKELKINEVLTLDQGFRKVGLTVRPLL